MAVATCVDNVLEVIVELRYYRDGIASIRHWEDQRRGVILQQLVISEILSYIRCTCKALVMLSNTADVLLHLVRVAV